MTSPTDSQTPEKREDLTRDDALFQFCHRYGLSKTQYAELCGIMEIPEPTPNELITAATLAAQKALLDRLEKRLGISSDDNFDAGGDGPSTWSLLEAIEAERQQLGKDKDNADNR